MEQQLTVSDKKQLKTNRGLFKYLIFSALTLGIYAIYMIHAISHDLNIACERDGKHTRGLLLYFLFSIITLGIYALAWNIIACNRIRDNIESSGGEAKISGLSWFLWSTLGNLLFGLGSLIAEYKLLHGLNYVNELYNFS